MGIGGGSRQCCRKCRPMWHLRRQENCCRKVFNVWSLSSQLTSSIISERLISLLCILNQLTFVLPVLPIC